MSLLVIHCCGPLLPWLVIISCFSLSWSILVVVHCHQSSVTVLVHSNGGPSCWWPVLPNNYIPLVSYWWFIIFHWCCLLSLFLVHCGCQSKTLYVIRHKQGENGFHHLIKRWSFIPHLQPKCSVK